VTSKLYEFSKLQHLFTDNLFTMATSNGKQKLFRYKEDKSICQNVDQSANKGCNLMNTYGYYN